MVIESMSENPPQSAGEGREVAVRSRRDRQSGQRIRSRQKAGKSMTYREGNARGEFSNAVALSRVCKM